MKRSLNIMVVDNEELVTQSIVDMLEMHGHRAKAYYSAESALEAILEKREVFDVVLTDINMPRMDGYSFIERVRNDGFTDVRILVLTGYGSIDGAVKAIKLGASGYFEKDRDPELLLFDSLWCGLCLRRLALVGGSIRSCRAVLGLSLGGLLSSSLLSSSLLSGSPLYSGLLSSGLLSRAISTFGRSLCRDFGSFR